jgi:hypothetical protein
MKHIILIGCFVAVSFNGFTQSFFGNTTTQESHQGKVFLYWGWNRGWYSKSDITFAGDNYNFRLDKVVAKDRQTHFDPSIYLNPGRATIPQYDFRIGYYFKKNLSLSFGFDHMKYVVQQGQHVKMSGTIAETGTPYDGSYSHDDVVIQPGFLQLEHTNGLNYLNLELRHLNQIADFNKVKINLVEGVGAGGLYPKTDATVLGYDRNDEWHWSGFGLDALVGVNVEFFKYFFVQSEIKGGFIDMPDIRITSIKSDQAKQYFFFSQLNVVFGANINLMTKDKN